MKPVRVFSYGGGIQSTACLVLAAQGRISYDYFVMCNVGTDSENPATLKYFQEFALPFAQKHDLRLIIIDKWNKRRKAVETVYQRIMREGSRSIGIPMRMGSNGAPGRRNCTADFKIRNLNQWMKKETSVGKTLAREQRIQKSITSILNASKYLNISQNMLDQAQQLMRDITISPRPLAIVGLGISTDEWHRARKESGVEWKALEYPLLDLNISRAQCEQIITNEGLILPPESSCWFCPYHTTARWQRMRVEQPEQFENAGNMETIINQRRTMLGKDAMYMHHSLKPLREAIPLTVISPQQDYEERQAQCVEGGCFL